MAERKNTYITLHKNFVRTDIEYTDRNTGEVKTFNSVTLPGGTEIDGRDVSYYQFSPLFVNPSRFHGENYRDIPLLTDREVVLQRSVLDESGEPVLVEDSRRMKDVVRVMPAQIKEAIDAARESYKAARSAKDQSLESRASRARAGSAALSQQDVPFDEPAR